MFLSKRTLIAAILAGTLTVSASAAFSKTATYTDGKFADVLASEWYASEVAGAFELGLMNGTTDTTFEPNGNVTVAEAITMASRAAAINAGETIPDAEGEWYQKYVNYAVSRGFVTDGQFDNYDRPAKRYEVASLFESAMPDGYFAAKNDVTAIPDVSAKKDYNDELLTLYKAGVVMGSDSYGNFFPENNIIRAEAAAIINRVALPENRLSKTLDKVSDDNAYMLVTTPTFNANKEGINSGWLLDNRGGTPRTDITASYSALNDISTEAGTAMIREINKTTTGSVRLECSLAVSGGDGAYLEYRNDAGESVYRLEVVDGNWQVLGADGKYTTVYEITKSESKYTFLIDVDLDNNRSTTYINDKNCGTHALCTTGEKTNLLNFRIATTEKGTPSVALGTVTINVNYAVKESSISTSKGWVTSDGSKGSSKLAKDVVATRSFNPVSGKVIAETFFLLPKGEAINYALRSGDKALVTFTTDDKNFYANGTAVYENYYQNLWYRLRIEADTDAQTAVIKINGRKVGEVPFAAASTSADNITVFTAADSEPSMTTFRVFREWERDDYVPQPTVPKGEEKYTVGLNVCSLWTNGAHFGWSCITPYDDPHPVLGYYDEMNPETADWEIKYLVEHGVDFGAYCVYFNSTNGPQNLGENHLYNGFMNAKYSDLSKFCIIWETANASSPNSLEAWKNDYVPYFIENFFKDPRHMTIDNRPVLCVFGADKIASRLGGSNAKVKECFDYLEDEVRKLGFDGMIYLACGSSSASLAEMGFDGCYAYNWGNEGYALSVNKNSILSSAANTALYTIPTISVGFNSIPWHGTRYPMMTKSDFAAAQEWIKSDYFTTYPKEEWQKNFTMISTWNEYGEGTYIMPTTDEKGFQYLDVLRTAYTDEKEDASLNTIPTEAQLTRINRLYPQYRRLLRKEGYYTEALNVDDLEVRDVIKFAEIENMNKWSMTEVETDDKTTVTATSTTPDPIFNVAAWAGDTINLDKASAIRLTAKIPKGNKIQLFFTSEAGPSVSESQSKTLISETDEMTTYVFNMSTCPNWKGDLLGFRLDPTAAKGTTFTVDSLEFLGEADKAPNEMTINGLTFETKLPYQTAENGDMLVPFDPSVAMDFRLHSFHDWNKETGVLTLHFEKNTIVYTVGSDKYTLDGVAKTLPYKLTTFDGLPLLPIKQLCADLGYTYAVKKDGTVSIDTDQKDYFEQIANRTPGTWDFNLIGDTEGWTSTYMTMLVNEGYLALQTNSQEKYGDPVMFSKKLELPAAKYKTLEYRVRYEHLSDRKEQLVLYFITDKDPNWSESKTLKIDLPSASSNGEWLEFSYDIANQSLWKDTITQVRFDPFNAGGWMDIDYIHLVEDPDYVYVDPAKAPFTLINPDAEGKDVAFYNGGADIKIVEDPDNKGNHYYQILPKDDKKIWLYATQGCTYKPGATYKVECDFRLLSNGTKKELDSNFKATLLFNAQYTDLTQAAADHVVARKETTVGAGWTHFTFEFTVGEKSKRGSDRFAFYTDPISEMGVGYALDNIVVTEILPEESK